MVASELASSRRQARELIDQNAVRINGERAEQGQLSQAFALFDQYWIVQKVKSTFDCSSVGNLHGMPFPGSSSIRLMLPIVNNLPSIQYRSL